MKKFLYYFLSFTWGLPLTLAGCIVALVLTIAGKKSKKFGLVRYFTIGKNWGGLELGVFFLTDPHENYKTKCHEFGHSLQNCIWGPLMIFVICLPSVIRYWYRELKYNRKGKNPPTKYDDIWFEGQATEWGTKVYENHII